MIKIISDNLIDEILHNLRSRTLTTIPADNIIIQHTNRLLELTTNTFHSIVLNSDKVQKQYLFRKMNFILACTRCLLYEMVWILSIYMAGFIPNKEVF
jgi:hypothetical protein